MSRHNRIDDRNKFPYFHLVPLDVKENLRFRWYITDVGCKDEEFASDIWVMCSRDPLFFISTFVYAYDPRSSLRVTPFIPYEFQQYAVSEYLDYLGLDDVLTEKSRDMGASWLHMLMIDWLFLFKEMTSSLCASRVEDLVDKRDDPDSLFWKLDFIHKHLPPFLRPPTDSNCRKSLHFYNPNTQSTIDGCSTNDDLGRGGRRTLILLDEFAAVPNGHQVLRATRDATRCRMFNSTPQGIGNAFHSLVKTDIKKVRLHWQYHPTKRLGLYTSKKGKLRILDKEYDWDKNFPDGYNHILDGKLRSVFYDEQCRRASHPMEIAQELDIDYLGSDYQFFDSNKIDEYIRKYTCDPIVKGEIDFDIPNRVVSGFTPNDKGRLSLWLELEENGTPPKSEYVIGCDIAAGTGASNSVISIGDMRTNRKVGEFVSPHLQPYELAHYAWAVAKWFHNAFVIYENNGAGRNFGSTLVGSRSEDKMGYPRVYYRQTNEESMDKRLTMIPGWASTGQTKKVLIADYRKALTEETMINPCYEAVNECNSYVYTSTGFVSHASAINTLDPSGARDNHGDRVIADALLCKMFVEKIIKKDKPKEKHIPTNCFFARQSASRFQDGTYENGWRVKWRA